MKPDPLPRFRTVPAFKVPSLRGGEPMSHWVLSQHAPGLINLFKPFLDDLIDLTRGLP